MDNEEYIYDEELEQQDSGSYSRKKRPQKSNNNLDKGRQLIKDAKDGTLKENVEKVKSGIGDMKSGDTKSGVSKIMDGTDGYRPKGKIEEAGSDIKNFGEGMKKVGEGAEKAGKSLQNSSKAGKQISDAGEKAAKAAKQAGKALETAGRATEAAGRGIDAAGKATSAGGKAASTAGDAVNTAGIAADATVVGAPVGVAANVAGTVASIGGKATEAAGAGEQAAGQATIAAGKAQQAAGKAQQAGATAAEAGAKAGKKAGSFGEKFGLGLEKTGKKVKETGEAVKDFGEKVEKVGKNTTSVLRGITTLLNPVKMFFIILATGILALLIFFAAVLYPLFTSVEVLKKGADFQEKINSFTWGLGFGNSIDAFYSELEFLNKHYEGSINEELLMATLFYTDIMNDKNVLDEETSAISTLNNNDSFMWGSIYSAINYFGDEALTETDDMGRVYSANKTFRLKKLAKNMTSKDGETDSTSLFDYFAINSDIISSDVDMLYQNHYSLLGVPATVFSLVMKFSMQVAILNVINQFPIIGPFLSSFLALDFFKIDMAESDYIEEKFQTDIASLVNFGNTAEILFEDLLSMFTDIEGIELELSFGTSSNSFDITITINEDGLVCDTSGIVDFVEAVGDAAFNFDDFDFDLDCDLEYSVFSYDEDKYEEYLKTDYLRNMPEFREYITDDGTANGNIVDERVDELYDNIYTLAKTWEEVNEEADASALMNNVCIGNINLKIIDQLALPINLNEGDEVIFTNKTAFGYTVDGNMHLGVDLNEESVGVHAGDPVYAVYDGEVQTSTASGNYPEDVTGGWLSYQFNISYDINDSDIFNKTATTTITIIYGGLDPNSVPAKGTRFNKGDIIGYIGDENASENGKPPGLHFGFIDGSLEKGRYLNPINIFITCSEEGDGSDDGVIIHPTSRLMVHEIGLKKSQFIEATKEYIKKGGRGAENLQKWDLNEVYKYSVKYNINPELIVIRAIVEGFSPSFYDSKYASYYNYWGIGCGNSQPLSSCSNYENFEMGIKGFASLDIVANADTIEEMMGRYAQIGAVWLDRVHGGSGAGGCYYIDAEEPYIRAISPARADLVRRTCDDPNYICTSASDTRCLRTIWDIDQQAHVDYNCREMNALFDEIYAPYHQGVASDQIEAYIKVMVDIANDDSHGYNMNYDRRTMNPDVDCTSLVYYGLVLSGTIPDSGGPFYTATMGKILKDNGFTEYRFDPSILQRGDIVMYHTENSDGSYSGHAITYLGDGKQVAANGCKKAPRTCDPGDQADEVSVSNFSGSNYHYIYRLEQ